MKLTLVFIAGLVVCVPGFASVTQILYPGDDGYISNTTLVGTGSLSSFDTTTSLGSGALTVNFSDTMTMLTAGPTGDVPWSVPPVSEGAPALIADTFSAATPWDITLTPVTPLQTFGLEMEPDGGIATLTAVFTLSNGNTTSAYNWGSLNGNMAGGARLFAISVSPGLTIKSVELTNSDTSGNNTMSIGNIREGSQYITSPEPGTSLLLGAGLIALGLLARRFRTA